MILVTGFACAVGLPEGGPPKKSKRSCVRRRDESMPYEVHTVQAAGMTDNTDRSRALVGVSVVMHAAARVDLMDDTAADPLIEFRRVNVQGTLQSARQAAVAGVSRFGFVSSIKVNGEATQPSHPFTADDTPAPGGLR